MSQYEQCSLSDVVNALQFIDADCSRDDWVQVGMAIKSEFADAFDVFDAWSQNADSYKPRDCLATWKSIKASGGVGIGTLFKQAMGRGFEFDKRELTDAEKREFAIEREARAKKRAEVEAREQAETAAWHKRIAEAAQYIWLGLVPEGESEYLAKKQVGAYGVRFVQKGLVIVFGETPEQLRLIHGRAEINAFFKNRSKDDSLRYLKKGQLVVPLFDEGGELVNLQIIYKTGDKAFLKHGRKSGCYHLVGEITEQTAVLAFAEGYATAASIHEATGWPVVVTFDCGNIPPVVRMFRSRYPSLKFLIAADDDSQTKNAGITKAREAANECGAAVVLPVFSEVA
ncbi:PriCT-2 domain-containing protein [Gilvimarinus agarilyticus]|uniref:PriCT-2 domain-containing protein n=1 Tax=Gilvimarinus agarilyticus TaxID=679259 RepID=UPI0006991A68|nr:PriCT-2 domain-containing protein [Gilvimarinus agarilyticus]